MSYISISGRTVRVDVDAPEPLPSFARIVKTVEWPTQRTIKVASLIFTAYKIYGGIGDELVDILQEFVELLMYSASRYSVVLTKYASASVTVSAKGSASATVVSQPEQTSG